MHSLKSLLLFSILSVVLSAQQPQKGSVIPYIDGEIGFPLGGIVSEENDFGDLNTLQVISDNGSVLETTTVEYRHFNWSAGGGIDIFLNSHLGLGLNGGYNSIQQKVVAENNALRDNTGQLLSLGTFQVAVLTAFPVKDDMSLMLKLSGGFSIGSLMRVPTMVQMIFDGSDQIFQSYLENLNNPIDVAGGTGSFEVKLNILQKTGLIGSIGLRYGMQYLKDQERNLYYMSEEKTLTHTISLTTSVGFGFHR